MGVVAAVVSSLPCMKGILHTITFSACSNCLPLVEVILVLSMLHTPHLKHPNSELNKNHIESLS